MRPGVFEAFRELSGVKEGKVPWMYTDLHKDSNGNLDPLVTTAIGNLIDGSQKNNVFTYQWTHGVGGSIASRDEIEAAWQVVKREGSKLSAQDVRGGSPKFAALTDLRLSDEEIERIFRVTLDDFERRLKQRFPSYDSWPADAQLGLLSMAWAMGTGFNYPRFQAAANDDVVPNFDIMARESGIPGNRPRTEAQDTLFSNAAAVVRGGLDPDRVYFPGLAEGAKQVVKAGGIGLVSMLIGAGALYGGLRFAKHKGWVT